MLMFPPLVVWSRSELPFANRIFGAWIPPLPAVIVTLLELEKSNVVGVGLARLTVIPWALRVSHPKVPPPTIETFNVPAALRMNEPPPPGGFGNLLESMLMLESDSIA